jgi:hypothetical protein
MALVQRYPTDQHTLDAEHRAAEHVADVARALAEMRGMASSISTTQPIGPAGSATIRQLLPSLCARFGADARCEGGENALTVTFVRRIE